MADPIVPRKRCCRCKAVKPLTDFHQKRLAKDGRNSMCAQCNVASVVAYQKSEKGKAKRSIRLRKWNVSDKCREYHREYSRRPEQVAKRIAKRKTAEFKINRRAWELRHDFGMTLDDYSRMLQQQSGVCGICKGRGRRPFLSVDHDHATGAVRGLLCENCNLALGAFRDNIPLLTAAIEYLRTYSGVESKSRKRQAACATLSVVLANSSVSPSS